MPTSSVSRSIDATAAELWEVISDPYHLPRWWPRVERVEDVDGDAFTEVMRTAKGKIVRADFRLVRVDESGGVLTWAQQVTGTPFERVLLSAETEVKLAPAAGGGADGSAYDDARPGAGRPTEVTIELRQTLNNSLSNARTGGHGLGRYFRGFGNHMVRHAATATLRQALDGLEAISGRV